MAPMFGFKNSQDYRREASTDGKLHNIKIPCLALNAQDDFLIDQTLVPYKEFAECDNLILAETKAGGHVCHFGYGRFGIFPTHWFYKPVAEYFRFMASANKI